MQFDTVAKDLARTLVTSRPLRCFGDGVDTALLLPERLALDVRRGMTAGLLVPGKTELALVDYSCQKLRQARLRAASLGFASPYAFAGDLARFPLATWLDGRMLDYAFLDMCATFSQPLAFWIRHVLVPNLSPGAALALTLTRTRRNSLFMIDVANFFLKRGQTLLRSSRTMLGRALTVGNAEMVERRRIDRREYPTTNKVQRATHPQLGPWFHDSSTLQLALLRLLMPYHVFDVDVCCEYKKETTCGRGGHRMTALRLINLRRTDKCQIPRYILDDGDWLLLPVV